MGISTKVIIYTFSVMIYSCSSQQFTSQLDSSTTDIEEDIDTSQHEATANAETATAKVTQAVEPVSVAGAFLTCSYPAGQAQNAAQFQLNCQLDNMNHEPMRVDTSFSKIDSDGNMHKLEVLEFDSLNWQWVLAESPQSLFLNTLLVEMMIDGSGPFMFSFELDQPIAVTIFTNFWLIGEPNNTNGIENCVEILNTVGQVNHILFTGLPSLPLQRLNDVACNNNRNYLCKHNSSTDPFNKWIISSSFGVFDEYPTACPDNYKFTLPLSELEVMEVSMVVDSQTSVNSVWVPMRRNPAQLSEFHLISK